ncbi:phage terminase large subunit [Candidatus Pacearchaeota archaeon]|nr:phage terminase large subunit [Candidatus Pacearchaeota archaeon]
MLSIDLSVLTPDVIKRELLKRELEKSLLKYTQYMFLKQHKKAFDTSHHHVKICDYLERVYKGEIKNLLINVPPRYSKTEIVIKSFTSWCYAKNKNSNFIHLSYSDRLVLDNSSEIREIIKSEWYKELWDVDFKKDSDAKNKWKVKDGGIFYAAPTGGQITGMGAGTTDPSDNVQSYDWLEHYEEIVKPVDSAGFGGAILIDDPQKPDDAESDTVRNKINNRLLSTIMSRRNSPKKTPIIIIMQRLHEEDMTGFCLDGNTGENWHHLNLPALKDNRSLWPAKHSVEQLEAMKKADPYMFSGQYQQSPSPQEGGIFKRAWWKICDAIPVGARCVRGWDLAATTKKTSAYTAGPKMHEKDGIYYISDVQRFKGTPGEVEQNILNTARMDGIGCKVSLPLDPGAAGKTVEANYMKLLAGFNIEITPESGSKEDRAKPFSAQCQAGNVYLVRGEWNKEYINEHANFPNGKFKDQVDASSRAFSSLTSDNVGKFSSAFCEKTMHNGTILKDEW